MTIGPEPMTTTERISGRSGMSVRLLGRLGSRTVPMGDHELDEPVEQVLPVVGARGRLGMELHGEGRHVQGPQPFDDVVVQPDVRDLDGPVAARVVGGRAGASMGASTAKP